MPNQFKIRLLTALSAIVFTLCPAWLRGQTAAARASFEAVSVKLHPIPPEGIVRGRSPAAAIYTPAGFSSDLGRFAARQMRLGDLFEFAYGIPSDRIEGQPDWANRNSWDILATTSALADLAQQKLMLQTLLEDRFALRVTRKSKEGHTYALVPGKKPNLTISQEDAGSAVGRIRLASIMTQEHSTELMAIGLTYPSRILPTGSLSPPVAVAQSSTKPDSQDSSTSRSR